MNNFDRKINEKYGKLDLAIQDLANAMMALYDAIDECDAEVLVSTPSYPFCDELGNAIQKVDDWAIEIYNEIKLDMCEIVSAKMEYTGGGVWLTYGKLDLPNDDAYFLIDDMGAARICDAPFDDFDVTLDDDWQRKHLIRELDEYDRIQLGRKVTRFMEGKR